MVVAMFFSFLVSIYIRWFNSFFIKWKKMIGYFFNFSSTSFSISCWILSSQLWVDIFSKIFFFFVTFLPILLWLYPNLFCSQNYIFFSFSFTSITIFSSIYSDGWINMEWNNCSMNGLRFIFFFDFRYFMIIFFVTFLFFVVSNIVTFFTAFYILSWFRWKTYSNIHSNTRTKNKTFVSNVNSNFWNINIFLLLYFLTMVMILYWLGMNIMFKPFL